MLTKLQRGSTLVALISTCLVIAASCQITSEKPTQSSKLIAPPTRQSQLERYEVYSRSNAAFKIALNNADVQAGFDILEAEGCSWVPGNSRVLISEKWGSTRSADASLDRPAIEKELLSADTMIWLAFEPAVPDLANHTAIAYMHIGGVRGTMILEANVGVDPPVAIREGKIVNGVFQPSDPSTQTFWGCWGGAMSVAMGGCIYTNCGYIDCVLGWGVIGGGLGCGYMALIS